MSYENFVRVKVVTPVTNVATSFAILDAVAPQKLPPVDGGFLVLCDSPGNPSWIEVIQYTSRTGLGISGVTRGVEGTTAVAWTGNVYAFQALMAGEANLIQSTLAGKEPAITLGTTAQYWRGDKSFRDFFTDVRAATLTGLSTSTNAVITASDTVLSGLGKLQRQLTDALNDFQLSVRSTVLTGYAVGSNTVLTAADTLMSAFGKLQGQINARAPLASPTFTGVPLVPTAALNTNTLQASSTAFVQAAIANLINSAPGALDTLDELAAAMGDDPNFAATMTTALAGKEPSIVADTVNKFYSGTKTWRDLPTDVRATVLTGLSVASGTAVVAGDTLLVALGKLQKQCTDRLLLSGGKMTGYLNEATIVTLASASTVAIGTAPANTVQLTGTTTVNGFDSSTSGAIMRVLFSGVMTLVHSGNLVLPGNANLVTAVGDVAYFMCVATNTWYCVGYYTRDGQPVRVVDVAHGGTGATTQAGAQTALGLPPATLATPNTVIMRDGSGNAAVSALIATQVQVSTSIELGRTDGVSGPGIVDFHTGATAADYDARITGAGGNGASGNGSLQYIANGGHQFTGTVNGLQGVYDVGNRVWSTASFDPLFKMTVAKNGINNQYGYIYAPNYENLSVANQPYNSALMIGEAGLRAAGGPAPGHIYNAPSISFLWNGYQVKKLMMDSAGQMCWGDVAGQYMRINQNGNIYGDAWGGYLSAYLTTNMVTPYNIQANIAAQSTGGVVGSYTMGKNISGATQGIGVLFSGTSCVYSDSTGNNFGAVPGIWRCMTAVAANACAVFLRTS